MHKRSMLSILGTRSWQRWLPPFLESNLYELGVIWDEGEAVDINKILAEKPEVVVFLSHQETQYRDARATRNLIARGYGGTVICNTQAVVDLAFDKNAMARIGAEVHGLTPIPNLYFETAEDALLNGDGRLFLSKRNDGTEGKGMHYFDAPDQLHSALPYGSNDEILIQEFLEGEELSVNVVCTGSEVALYPIVSKGNTRFDGVHPSLRMRTCPAKLPKAIEDKVLRCSAEYMARIEHQGIAELEFILSGDRLYFLEINPRLAATMRLSTVVTGRSLFADYFAWAGGHPLQAGPVPARAAGAEWVLPGADPAHVQKVVSQHDQVWCSTNRITAAAPNETDLELKIAELSHVLSATISSAATDASKTT
ncbi:MAG: ATP-grasp domain-containing protein [Pseudomonadota bacterium]